MKEKHIILYEDNEKIQSLISNIEEYNICEIKNYETFLFYGYKFLSNSEKNLYRFLYNLSKNNNNLCNPSLEYLAITFSTTINIQKRRLRKLIKHKLITKLNNSNYKVNFPGYDKTFIETIETLILYKKLSLNIYLYTNSTNNIKRLEYLEEIKNLKNLGINHKNLCLIPIIE